MDMDMMSMDMDMTTMAMAMHTPMTCSKAAMHMELAFALSRLMEPTHHTSQSR
jgi:hypothetical protein